MLGEPGDGSSSIYLTEVLRELSERGHDVAVLCACHEGFGDYPHARQLASRITVYRGLKGARNRYGNERSDGVTLLRVIDDWKPDVAIVNNSYHLLSVVEALEKLKQLRVAYIPYGFDMVCPRVQLWHPDGVICDGPTSAEKCVGCIRDRVHTGVFEKLFLNLPAGMMRLVRPTSPWPDILEDPRGFQARLRNVLGRFDRVFCPSRVMLDMMARYGAKQENLVHLPYGISGLRRIDPQAQSKRANLRVGFLGYGGVTKGFPVLRAAMSQVAEPEKLRVHVYNTQLAREFGPVEGEAFQFRDSVSPFRIAEVYRNLDAVVVPSVWHENSPFVVLEALANGRPVVASDIRGISEHVTDGVNGLLFRPGDSGGLARRLDQLISDRGLVQALAGRCSYSRTVGDYVESLLKALN